MSYPLPPDGGHPSHQATPQPWSASAAEPRRRVGLRALLFTVAIGVALLVSIGTTLYATDLVDLDGPEPAKLMDGELAHVYGPQEALCQDLDYSDAEDFIAPALGAPEAEAEAGDAMAASSQHCTVRFFEESTEKFGQVILSPMFHPDDESAAAFFDPKREIAGDIADVEGEWAKASTGFDPDGGTVVMNTLDGNLTVHALVSFFHDAERDEATAIVADLVTQLMDVTRGNAYDAPLAKPEVAAGDQGSYQVHEDLCSEINWSDFDDFDFTTDGGAAIDSFEPADVSGYGTVRCGGGQYAEEVPDHAYVEMAVTVHPAISEAVSAHDYDAATLKERTNSDSAVTGSWDSGTVGEGKTLGGHEDGIYLNLAVQHENLSATVIFAYDGGGSQPAAQQATVALAEQLFELY